MATQLAGVTDPKASGPVPAQEKGLKEQSVEDLTEDIANAYPDSDLILQNVADVLSEELVTEYNYLLESGDSAQTQAAMETLKHRDDPSQFSAATPGHVINDEAIRYATETLGEEISSQIQTLSSAVMKAT